MSSETRPPAAHFRRVWFKPTETFLYTTVRGFRRSRPLLVGQERALAEAFPVQCPVLALEPPESLVRRLRERRARRLGLDPEPRFDTRRCRRALYRHGARVLHAHFGYTGCHVLPLARRTGLPLVTSFYGEDASALPQRPGWRERYAELFEAGALFLVEGPAMAQRLFALGCPREKVAIQHIAIELDGYPFRARHPKPFGAPVTLLFCASFREKKGLRYALEALALAREKHPELVLRVIGDGPGRGEAHELARRLGVSDRVRWLGFLPHREIIGEMDAADLFVQPSVTAADGDTEGGAPTTLLEAQACGVPVLATRHADIPHVVAEGDSALLVPERDADALAEHLRLLLDAPERWAEMGAAGRDHVERFHGAAEQVARLEDLYQAVAGEAA
jgi:colanic acid/amylovoran biosynthesis glycosyltransferase